MIRWLLNGLLTVLLLAAIGLGYVFVAKRPQLEQLKALADDIDAQSKADEEALKKLLDLDFLKR